MAVRLGNGNDLQGLLALGMMLREELGGCEEHRAGQARVGMQASLHGWELAVPIRERVGDPRQLLFRPGGFGKRACGADLDGLAFRVDLAGGFPVPADGGVAQPGLMSCHFTGLVIEDLLDDVLADVPVHEGRSPASGGTDAG